MNEEATVQDAVILLAYGGPSSLDEVEPFLVELMGREPSPEVVERVHRRYLTIGGKSPLPEIAGLIASALEERLAADGSSMPVSVGFRYTEPRIASTLGSLYEQGVRRVAAISLSPFESETTSVAYKNAVDDALLELPGMEVIDTPMINTLREFEVTLAGGFSVALENILESARDKSVLVFTAHSLPVPDLKDPDPYCEGLRSLADRVAYGLGLGVGFDFSNDERLPGISAYGDLGAERPWLLAYQSAGQRPCEWLGPDVGDVVDAIAAAGHPGVVIQPIGFVTDHMETLYDLDVEMGGKAFDLGLEFARGPVPNATPMLIVGLAGLVRDAFGLTAAGPEDDEKGTPES